MLNSIGMGSDRLPGPQPTYPFSKPGLAARASPRKGVAALDQRALELDRPRALAAEGRIEAVRPRCSAHDQGRDVPVVAERELRRCEAGIELGAELRTTPRRSRRNGRAGDVLA